MKIDLSDVKSGDRLFSSVTGEEVVHSIQDPEDEEIYPLYLESGDPHMLSGIRYHVDDQHPSLFHSIDECIEYFKWVKESGK